MIGGGLALMAGTTAADATPTVKKDYVCKYVGTPGVDERLQTGKNPIWVSTDFPQGSFFNDAHGRSFVLIANTVRLNPEPDVTDCPPPGPGPTDPTTGPTEPTTAPTEPTTGPTEPTTAPTSGFISPAPGNTSSSSTPSEGINVPQGGSVPTVVHAGLAEGSGGSQSPLGWLLTVLGGLMAAGGTAVAVTGRVPGAHQL